MTPDEKDAEIRRLHAFILTLAQRLFLAAEVLANRAEKREKKLDQAGTG